MTNDNQFKPFLNIPKTETKIVLTDWSQPTKKSKLSTVARSKVINRSGSNYLSSRATINNPSYGPMCGHPNKGKSKLTVGLFLASGFNFKEDGVWWLWN